MATTIRSPLCTTPANGWLGTRTWVGAPTGKSLLWRSVSQWRRSISARANQDADWSGQLPSPFVRHRKTAKLPPGSVLDSVTSTRALPAMTASEASGRETKSAWVGPQLDVYRRVLSSGWSARRPGSLSADWKAAFTGSTFSPSGTTWLPDRRTTDGCEGGGQWFDVCHLSSSSCHSTT